MTLGNLGGDGRDSSSACNCGIGGSSGRYRTAGAVGADRKWWFGCGCVGTAGVTGMGIVVWLIAWRIAGVTACIDKACGQSSVDTGGECIG